MSSQSIKKGNFSINNDGPNIPKRMFLFFKRVDTPDPQPPFLKEILSYVFWGTWGMFQGSVGIFLGAFFQQLGPCRIAFY